MGDDPPVVQMIEMATSTAPLRERAQGLLETLARFVPSEATWLALSDPLANVHATVGSTGLDGPVLDYLDRPSVGGRSSWPGSTGACRRSAWRSSRSPPMGCPPGRSASPRPASTRP